MTQTTIGSSVVIDGEVTGDEELLVLGTVKGRITTKEHLQIAAAANVEADIDGATVTISGQVVGNIHAGEKVEITSEGRMVGDIRSPRILIADGASFKGSIDMDS